MAMAWRVAATLRVKYKIDFIFDSQGGAPPFRLKYKIDFIFDSEGPGRVAATQPMAKWPLTAGGGIKSATTGTKGGALESRNHF